MRPAVQPSVTHFHQYPAIEILDRPDGYWMIVFQGGGTIGGAPEKPDDEIVGLGLLTSIITADEVTLKFGRMKAREDGGFEPEYLHDVVIPQEVLTITDERYDSLPQLPDDDDLPEPVRGEHEADGPTEEGLKASHVASDEDEEAEQAETTPED